MAEEGVVSMLSCRCPRAARHHYGNGSGSGNDDDMVNPLDMVPPIRTYTHKQQQEAEGVDRHGDNDNLQQRDSSLPAQGDLAVVTSIPPNGLEAPPSPQTAVSRQPNALTTNLSDSWNNLMSNVGGET